MRTMIRKLFIEPMMAPTLSARNTQHDIEGTRIIKGLATVVMDPSASAMGPAAAATKQLLEDIAVGTPVTARVLMAYIAGMCFSTTSLSHPVFNLRLSLADLTLGLESLYWMVKPRNDKAISRQDVIDSFTTYRASQERVRVHEQICDYIGDEDVRFSLLFLHQKH